MHQFQHFNGHGRTTNNAPAWIKISIVYLVLGIAIGIVMGASHDFSLRPLHAHVNLLGWATMAVAGLVYAVFPRAGASKLAKVHFWLQNLATPAMLVALGLVVKGNTDALPVLVVAQIVATIAILVFALNIFLNVSQDS